MDIISQAIATLINSFTETWKIATVLSGIMISITVVLILLHKRDRDRTEEP